MSNLVKVVLAALVVVGCAGVTEMDYQDEKKQEAYYCGGGVPGYTPGYCEKVNNDD